jgi:hypothetical protein
MPSAGTGMESPSGSRRGPPRRRGNGRCQINKCWCALRKYCAAQPPAGDRRPPGSRRVTPVVTTVTGRVPLFLGESAFMHVFDVTGRIDPSPAESAQRVPYEGTHSRVTAVGRQRGLRLERFRVRRDEGRCKSIKFRWRTSTKRRSTTFGRCGRACDRLFESLISCWGGSCARVSDAVVEDVARRGSAPKWILTRERHREGSPMTRRAVVTLAAVALWAGVFVSGAKAVPPICGSRACAEETAAGCGSLSRAGFRECQRSVLDQCKVGNCTCTPPDGCARSASPAGSPGPGSVAVGQPARAAGTPPGARPPRYALRRA